MNKIGLALSGGGFRASLYHLGLVRFLRDAGMLSRVTHITSVSGGSILAAHLVLNWERYNGSPSEFDEAASEFLSFVRLDVRNRITRRFPLTIPLRWPRRLLGRSNRKLTRTGLLEFHYEKYLYGDTSLFELPAKPQLHLLSTNLSEGCLCSFMRDGLLVVRRQEGNGFRIDRIHIGLATVAMAVTASSAFPGFFPPVELTGADVGASVGEFGRQAYTDGGVFDNLGVRMFRCLERALLLESPLSRDDFFDLRGVVEALRNALVSSEESLLRPIVQVLAAAHARPDPLMLPSLEAASKVLLPQSSTGLVDGEELVVSTLRDVLRHYQFQREPLFAGLTPADPEAEALLDATRGGERVLDTADQLWLNRHLLEAAFRQATGRACFRRLNSGLDGVLVSDVGKRIEVLSNRRAGGLIRTALRASDILMDRVWQLEIDTFQDTPGFVFAPITEVVEPADDPTALHPEIQRHVANIRTDLDRFSALEISSLARHGYCVGRKSCRARPDLFGTDLPADAPWDPIPAPRRASSAVEPSTHPGGSSRAPAPATVEARRLQASAFRRIWSTLLDGRDWTSYVYVPIIVPILCLLPYFLITFYQRSHRINRLVESLSQSSRELGLMTRLLEHGPEKPWTGVAAEEAPRLDEPDLKGFEILQDSRILDMRPWKPFAPDRSDVASWIHGYRRLKVLKQPESAGNNNFRIGILPTAQKAEVRFPRQRLQPTLHTSAVDDPISGQKMFRRQVSFDFQKVPAGESADLLIDFLFSKQELQAGETSATLDLNIQAETAEFTVWLLMPEGKEYRSFRVTRYKAGNPGTIEVVQLVSEYLADDFTILAFKLLSVKAGYTYEIAWSYK
jgi:predicted acylesterase/phospholipase RssA